MKYWLAGFLGVTLISSSWAESNASSSKPACRGLRTTALSSLNQVQAEGNFRIHYAVRGKHAVASVADTNGNGTPDVIDDLALQLKVANELYSGVIGMRPPLQQPRYKAAQHINVYMLDIKKGNGQAFDEVVSERIRQESQTCGLRIYIDSSVKPSRNLTPAHELFHLYQYGYAMFKASWYVEGMARWVESFFKPGKTAGQAATKPHMTCDKAYTQSYGASAYWLQQAQVSGRGAASVPANLSKQRYIDGRAVIATEQLHGGVFLLRVMQLLEAGSLDASKAKQLPPYRWTEKQQRSAEFNNVICAASQEAAAL